MFLVMFSADVRKLSVLQTVAYRDVFGECVIFIREVVDQFIVLFKSHRPDPIGRKIQRKHLGPRIECIFILWFPEFYVTKPISAQPTASRSNSISNDKTLANTSSCFRRNCCLNFRRSSVKTVMFC